MLKPLPTFNSLLEAFHWAKGEVNTDKVYNLRWFSETSSQTRQEIYYNKMMETTQGNPVKFDELVVVDGKEYKIGFDYNPATAASDGDAR